MTNKSFQPEPSPLNQRGSVTRNLSSYNWVMSIRAVSESLRLSTIPSSSEKTTTSCIPFTRS